MEDMINEGKRDSQGFGEEDRGTRAALESCALVGKRKRKQQLAQRVKQP